MSDFFKDKKFEEMDWISQAVEPIEWSVNDNLSNIPDVIEVDYALLSDVVASHDFSYGGPGLYHILQAVCRKGDISINWNSVDVSELFDLIVQPGTTIDLSTRTIEGRIQVIKLKHQIDNRKVMELMAISADNKLWDLDRGAGSTAQRTMEIADLCGAEHLMKGSRSPRNRSNIFRTFVVMAIREDKWRIRNVDLCAKIIGWIVDYVNSGNLASLANFAKFKVMTHNEQPIYSIEEVE